MVMGIKYCTPLTKVKYKYIFRIDSLIVKGDSVMDIKEKEVFIKEFINSEKEKVNIPNMEKDSQELLDIFNKHYLRAMLTMLLIAPIILALYVSNAELLSKITVVLIMILLLVYPGFVLLTYICYLAYKSKIKTVTKTLEDNQYGEFKYLDIVNILETNHTKEEYSLKINKVYTTLKSIN